MCNIYMVLSSQSTVKLSNGCYANVAFKSDLDTNNILFNEKVSCTSFVIDNNWQNEMEVNILIGNVIVGINTGIVKIKLLKCFNTRNCKTRE